MITKEDVLPELEEAARATRRMLERVPQDQLCWTPRGPSIDERLAGAAIRRKARHSGNL
jgi:hypothetical protein